MLIELDVPTNVVDAVGQTRFSYTDAGHLLSEDGPWAEDTVSYSHSARRRKAVSPGYCRKAGGLSSLASTARLQEQFGYAYDAA